jgi:DNA-binding NarL/FixJ family response regulator
MTSFPVNIGGMAGRPLGPRERPSIWLAGRADHPDFRAAVAILHSEAEVSQIDARRPDAAIGALSFGPPELIVLALDRPGAICQQAADALRARAPLAPLVSLSGSWCEGEPRTGRPIAGALRIYWYEFPAWWWRQLALRAAGLCPDWARPECARLLTAGEKRPSARRQAVAGCRNLGLIELAVPWWETADALADELLRAGYAALWRPPGRPSPVAHGVVAGIWMGGQLDDCEAHDLAAFRRRLDRQGAPVVAVLDFPRNNTVDRALALGAAAVLGAPWMNAELIETVERTVEWQSRTAPRSSAQAA